MLQPNDSRTLNPSVVHAVSEARRVLEQRSLYQNRFTDEPAGPLLDVCLKAPTVRLKMSKS